MSHWGGGGMSQLTNPPLVGQICFHPTPSLDGTRTLACSLESRRPACALTSGGSGVMSNLSFSKTACPVCLKRRLVSLHDPGGCQLVGLKRRLVILHDPRGCQLAGWKRRQANLPGSGGCQLVGLERRLASSRGPGGRQLEAVLGRIRGASNTPLFRCLPDDV